MSAINRLGQSTQDYFTKVTSNLREFASRISNLASTVIKNLVRIFHYVTCNIFNSSLKKAKVLEEANHDHNTESGIQNPPQPKINAENDPVRAIKPKAKADLQLENRFGVLATIEETFNEFSDSEDEDTVTLIS